MESVRINTGSIPLGSCIGPSCFPPTTMPLPSAPIMQYAQPTPVVVSGPPIYVTSPVVMPQPIIYEQPTAGSVIAGALIGGFGSELMYDVYGRPYYGQRYDHQWQHHHEGPMPFGGHPGGSPGGHPGGHPGGSPGRSPGGRR